MRAIIYKQEHWNEEQFKTNKRNPNEQKKFEKQFQPKPLPKFFKPISTYIPPLSRKQKLLSEYFKVNPANKNALTISQFLKIENEKFSRDKQIENIISLNDIKKIDQSHKILESEEFKLWTQHQIFNHLNKQQVLLQKDLQESKLKEQRLEKILEEDNPFYFCEHENLLTRISNFKNGEIYLEQNQSHQTNNLKSYKISNQELSFKLQIFDNECYALKELIKQSIKAIYKNSIKNYGMSEDVENLFKQVKNLRSNSLIHITKCYLNPICKDLDSVVNINVQISKFRIYKISLQKISFTQFSNLQNYLDALKSEKESLENFKKRFDEVDTLLRNILLLKDQYHFFFSMGKFLDSYSERKEFFEGIIDGVFYVKKYAPYLKCQCKKENEKRLQEFNEEFNRHKSLLNDKKLVQKEKERLDRLNEEKENYVFQNKVLRDFEISKKIGRINSEIEKSFLNCNPQLIQAQCTLQIFKKLISKKDLRSYFMISNNIVLKFEINSIDTGEKLEYFFDENVNLSYDQNHSQDLVFQNKEQANSKFDKSELYAFLQNGELIEVGESCNEKDFNSLVQNLMISKINNVVQDKNTLVTQENIASNFEKKIESQQKFQKFFDPKKDFQTLFKQNYDLLNLQKQQSILKEIDQKKIQLLQQKYINKKEFDEIFLKGQTSNLKYQACELKSQIIKYPQIEYLVKGRVIVELMNNQKLVLSNEQFEDYSYTLAKGKAFGKFDKNLDIKSILQTYEKQCQEIKHSFKYIRKPVINEEPMNVQKSNCLPARSLKKI